MWLHKSSNFDRKQRGQENKSEKHQKTDKQAAKNPAAPPSI